MKYTKRISVGAFLRKGEDIKDGDIVTIASEGKQVEGQFGMQDVFLIKTIKGLEGNVTFNTTTINNLIDGYGEDSLNWVGKEAKVSAILQNVQGKMCRVYYFLHPESELDEKTGQFIIKNNLDKAAKTITDDIPVIEDDGMDQIDPNSIPF